MLDLRARDGAKAIGQSLWHNLHCWPPVVENGFLKAMTYAAKEDGLSRTPSVLCGELMERQEAARFGGGSDGRIMFHLDPGLGINY